ncbi:flagellar hook-associated protein FlgK [Sphingobium aquiterrae]|uniref:flagellar hook-associated protein FlgK n=1 Tax=Sphingobium aquiterrae TaxID=2038656 RepID=UPI003017D442
MSDLFIIGASGTKAYRTAMAAISENIANASTDGYTRRSVTTRESGSSSATMVFYQNREMFGGTYVSSVNRAVDPYLDATVRMTSQSLSSSTSRLRWMTDVQTALNDGSTGIGQRLSTMFGTMEKLAASPNDTSLRTTTLSSIEQVAEAFRATAADLKDSSAGIATEAQASVDKVNSALDELARVNNSLLRAQPGSSSYAQLLDSRDAAVKTVTDALDVSVTFSGNDQTSISFGGTTLLANTTATPLTLTVNGDGTLALGTAAGALATPGNGTLGGLFTSAGVAAQQRTALDTLAAQFVTDMNAWHAQGLTTPTTADPAGHAGIPLLSIGTGADSIAMLVTDTAELATRSSDGTLNGNLLNATTALRGTGSVEQGWTALVAGHATLTASTSAEQTAAQTRNDQAVTARENVSGVDLDMEAADLLRIQQAYSGCAKILQAARDTVDAILQIM